MSHARGDPGRSLGTRVEGVRVGAAWCVICPEKVCYSEISGGEVRASRNPWRCKRQTALHRVGAQDNAVTCTTPRPTRWIVSLGMLSLASTCHLVRAISTVSTRPITVSFASLKTPVVILEAADPDMLLVDDDTLASEECDVYGATMWPSSYAAASVLSNLLKYDAKRTRVIELGCGPGLPALTALAAGAGEVIALDWSPTALALVLDAAHQYQPQRAHRLSVQQVNVRDPSQRMPWDGDGDGASAQFSRTLLVCADMLYQADTAKAVARCVASCLNCPDAMALLADPGRLGGQGREILLRELRQASGHAGWAEAADFVDKPIAQADLREFGASLSWCGKSEVSVGVLTVAR